FQLVVSMKKVQPVALSRTLGKNWDSEVSTSWPAVPTRCNSRIRSESRSTSMPSPAEALPHN
ncbi:unnamed protein product, partial [Rangifer tarandus platyrhynchus]